MVLVLCFIFCVRVFYAGFRSLFALLGCGGRGCWLCFVRNLSFAVFVVLLHAGLLLLILKVFSSWGPEARCLLEYKLPSLCLPYGGSDSYVMHIVYIFIFLSFYLWLLRSFLVQNLFFLVKKVGLVCGSVLSVLGLGGICVGA